MRLVRGRSRRLASGGLYRVRTPAAVPIQHHLPNTATVVLMVMFMYARRPNIRRMVANVTVRQKKQSNTADLTGAALTKKWFKRRGPSARQKASSVTTRSAKRRKIRGPKQAQEQSTEPTQTPLSYTVSDLGTLGDPPARPASPGNKASTRPG